jgi:hypothetical protein
MKRTQLVGFFLIACAGSVASVGCQGGSHKPAAGPETPSEPQQLNAPASPAPPSAPGSGSGSIAQPGAVEDERSAPQYPPDAAAGAMPQPSMPPPTPDAADSVESDGHGIRPDQPGETTRAMSEETRSADFARELHILDTRLRALAVSELANCGEACNLVEQMCTLKDTICRLKNESPAKSIVERCDDAQGRCERARQKTQAHCSCGDR